MIAKSSTRVTQNTLPHINERIQQRANRTILRAVQGGPKSVDRRLEALDREWDIERMIETQSSSAILAGLVLGTLVDRKWYLLSAAVAGFLLQHSIQGWCPPVPPLRRLGFRTAREIEDERNALLSLR